MTESAPAHGEEPAGRPAGPGVAGQIVQDLDAYVLWPLVPLLGIDAHDLMLDRAEARSRLLAAELTGADTRVRAQAVIDLMNALWGRGDPPDPWWTTSLGRACAAALAPQVDGAVTHQQAADMLGITRGSIAQMVARGTLLRHQDGGVDKAAVLRRLARPTEPVATASTRRPG
ncbi:MULTISPECIES: hypothetical protein [Promicromonospora]|uniref:DNA-binding protein n=2 Tax=Promicromonospora TaxID=43676 RepID=A0ABW4V1A3_9MICO